MRIAKLPWFPKHLRISVGLAKCFGATRSILLALAVEKWNNGRTAMKGVSICSFAAREWAECALVSDGIVIQIRQRLPSPPTPLSPLGWYPSHLKVTCPYSLTRKLVSCREGCEKWPWPANLCSLSCQSLLSISHIVSPCWQLSEVYELPRLKKFHCFTSGFTAVCY